MRIAHLSDLHLGKRLSEFSLIEDQQDMLNKIIDIIIQQNASVAVIAGDIYDRSVPSGEAVELFDEFITRLSALGVCVMIVSGNHDSAERLAFGNKLMRTSGVYISSVYEGKTDPVVLSDEYGDVNFYLLPFLKPSSVRRYFDGIEISTYDDAVRTAVANMNIDTQKRNVIVSHQFVTGASLADSEELCVGGAENIGADIYDKFDYVALGHIHRAQKVSRSSVRYSGTPLKYSFSEAGHEKSITIADIGPKGDVKINLITLVPLRDMTEIKGSFEEIVFKASQTPYGGTENFVHITLTDEEEITDAVGKLRKIYKYLLRLDYDNTRTRSYLNVGPACDCKSKNPQEYFSELYFMQNNAHIPDDDAELFVELISGISCGEVNSL